MKLHLLRHAAVPAWPGLCYGASDLPADEALTQAAAQAAAACLPRELTVWVSQRRRCLRLAGALQALRPDLGPAAVDARLNEMDFGCWELQPWSSIPRKALDDWTADFDEHRFGGVESCGDVLRRVNDALLQCRALAGPHGQALWITHAGVIRAVQHLVAHGAVPVGAAANWPRTPVPQGGLLTVELAPSGPA